MFVRDTWIDLDLWTVKEIEPGEIDQGVTEINRETIEIDEKTNETFYLNWQKSRQNGQWSTGLESAGSPKKKKR